MVIVGYTGIGKTQLALRRNNTIDLDSSLLNDDYGVKPEDWDEMYVNMAIELNKQGNDVFISAHHQVRNWLLWRRDQEKNFRIGLIYPSISLEDEWIQKIIQRDGDSRALDRVKEFYRSDIRALEQIKDLFDESYCIRGMDYDLEKIIYDFEGGIPCE